MANALSHFYRGKKVLVTGCTGFKGSWLCLWLRELGADVLGIALPASSSDDLWELAHVDTAVQFRSLDIRAANELSNEFYRFKPEIVFHLAAKSLVRESYSNPKETFDVNVGGSVNVLEACTKTESVKSLIFVTSDKCYKNKEWLWGYRENDELGGNDPYSASKAAAELVFHSYLVSFFCNRCDFGAATVRAGNVIGGGDWAVDRIVPDCIRSLRNGDSILLRNPESIRPWQHVLEPLGGYLRLAQRLFDEPTMYSGAWNFGPEFDSNKTVKELVTKIISSWGSGSIRVSGNATQMRESIRLTLNCDKSKDELKWRPLWGFKDTVGETVLWYKSVVVEKFDPLTVSQQQIRKYMERIQND